MSLRGQVSVQMSLFLWGHPWDGNCWVPCSSTFSLWRSCPLFPTVAAPLCTPPAFVLLPQQQRETHLYSPSQLRSLSRSCPKTSYLTQRQLQSPHISPGGPFNLQALRRGQGHQLPPISILAHCVPGSVLATRGALDPSGRKPALTPGNPNLGPSSWVPTSNFCFSHHTRSPSLEICDCPLPASPKSRDRLYQFQPTSKCLAQS